MATWLEQQEAAADVAYGFPSGTMQALGTSESSQGTDMGSLGNIFQVLPSTAANPGYGLSSVDGNSAMSAGAYLSKLTNSVQGSGNIANGLAMYQGRPIGSTGNTAMSNFLSQLGVGTGSTSASANDPNNISGSSSSSTSTTGSTTSAGAVAGAGTGGIVMRIFVAVMALILIVIGLAALALKTDVGSAAKTVASKAVL